MCSIKVEANLKTKLKCKLDSRELNIRDLDPPKLEECLGWPLKDLVQLQQKIEMLTSAVPVLFNRIMFRILVKILDQIIIPKEIHQPI